MRRQNGQRKEVYRNKMGIAFFKLSGSDYQREQQFDNPPSYLTVKLAAKQRVYASLY